jgi:DNA repair protein RadA/Sms
MGSDGLVEVLDASARFVGGATRAPGSVVLAAMEGTRPLLVEVQALVSPSELVPPRRVVNGIDRNRLALVLAVLGRHAGVGVGSADVFVNVVGGVRIDEPGADLAIALGGGVGGEGDRPRRRPAPRRVRRGRPHGELRDVAHGDRRREEAAKFGLVSAIGPEAGTLRGALRLAFGRARSDAPAAA